MPAWRCTEGGKRGAVCCSPDTDQQGPEQSQTEGTPEKPLIWRQRSSGLCPSSCVGPLPAAVFSLSASHHSNPLPLCRHDAGAGSMGSHQTHGLFRQRRARRTFDVPQGGRAASPSFSKAHPWPLCSHPELVCTLVQAPSPAAPLPQRQPLRLPDKSSQAHRAELLSEQRQAAQSCGAAAEIAGALPG